jgi:hypothetical protein
MNEQLVLFEGQEVKIKTDEGHTLINLVHTAKCCGLTQNKNGKPIIRWKSGDSSVVKKLNTIYSSGLNMPPQYMEEIKYILDEIENTDDRNSIYMSSWLSRRLSMECKSSKAMEYKNFLATLDEKRENGQLNTSNQQLVAIVSNTINAIMPTLITEMTQKLIPTVLEAKQSVTNMQSLMHDQSVIYDQERNELKSMIGMQSRNTKDLTDKLKYELERKYNERITAKDTYYINAKSKLFNKFRVQRWEQIPVSKYNDVFASIEEMFYE